MRQDLEFSLGDHVFLGLCPYWQHLIGQSPYHKLSLIFWAVHSDRADWVGHIPAEVITRSLDSSSLPCVSIESCAHGTTSLEAMTPLLVNDDMKWVCTLKDVQAIHHTSRGTEVLIHWKDLLALDDTWESSHHIITRFPNFHLEDKVSQLGGGERVLSRPLSTRTIHMAAGQIRREGGACPKATNDNWSFSRYSRHQQ